MAADKFSPEDMGFQSDRDIEGIFERDGVFTEELELQTLARLSWMLTRHRSAFLVLASELGIDPVTAAKLSTAQSVLSREFADFVSIGINANHAVPTPQHPLDETFNELVDAITEPRDYEHAAETLRPVRNLMDDLLCGSDEELLHKLEQLRSAGES